MKRLGVDSLNRSAAAKVNLHWYLYLPPEEFVDIPSSLANAWIYRLIQRYGFGFALGRFLRIESPRISMRWAL